MYQALTHLLAGLLILDCIILIVYKWMETKPWFKITAIISSIVSLILTSLLLLL